jgi:hypothetical protein
MVTASALEDRTRPANDEPGPISNRLRYLAWLHPAGPADGLGRRTAVSGETLLVHR